MWALTYDYLIGYTMEDMSPAPALATEWETSDDGLTWTFTMREGVMWSDGEPLTAATSPTPSAGCSTAGPRRRPGRRTSVGVESVEAPDATTVVLTLKKPNAVLPLLPIPIVPEHIWKDVSEKDVKSYPAEPTDGQPVVGSGPFRLVEGTAGGSTYSFEANPDYWKGAPHVDQVVFRVFKSEDPMVQALIKGEIDFVEGISALQVQSLEGEDGITAHNGDSPGFDEIAFNTGSVDLETGKPMGDPNPAVLDAAFRFALNFAIDREQHHPHGLPRGRQDRDERSSRRPTATTCGTRPTTRRVRLRPRQGRPAARRRRLHRRSTTAIAPCRPASPSASCDSRRAATRRRRSTSCSSSRSGSPTSTSTRRSRPTSPAS